MKKKFSLILFSLFLTYSFTHASSYGSKKSWSSSKSSSRSYSRSSSSKSKSYSSSKNRSSSKAKSSSSYGSTKSYSTSPKRTSSSSSKSTNSYGSKNSWSSGTKGEVKNNVASNSFEAKRAKQATAQRSIKALTQYKNQKSQFKATPTPAKLNKSHNKAILTNVKRFSSNRTYSKSSYYTRRTDYYSRRHYQPKRYIYNHAASFGAWDAMFLWMMLDTIQDASSSQYLYHNYNDPGIQQWMQVARQEAHQNEELKQKIAYMDQQMQQMQTKNVQRDTSYLPQGVDPDLAFSEEYIRANNSSFYQPKFLASDELDELLNPNNFK